MSDREFPNVEPHDLVVNLDPTWNPQRQRFALLRGWANRHKSFPAIIQQFQLARNSPAVALMFRGDKQVPRHNVFLLGVKSRPALYGGNIARLRFEISKVADDEVRFTELLVAFCSSPMVRNVEATPTHDRILVEYQKSVRARRVRLSQILVLAIQYQNSQRSMRPWRHLLFLVSCSRRDEVAARFALGHRAAEDFPKVAYLYEYAPPALSSLHEPAVQVLMEFEELGLQNVYPDRDNEVFVQMAMLPHYILGYAELRRVSTDRVSAVYDVNYHPHPSYASGEATLDNPPKLTEDQQALMVETRNQIAWVWWDRQTGDWYVDQNR
ncbi:MAG: hypothetical protein AABN34_18545 [Acidobacteriota bacterium]